MPEKSYNKDKSIKIFYLETKRTEEGHTITIKKYIHPLNSYLKAYIRDLSQKERVSNLQIEDDSTALAIINRREVNNTMFLEYKRRNMKPLTYNITGVDYYDDSTSEIKLFLSLVENQITYDEEEGIEWQK